MSTYKSLADFKDAILKYLQEEKQYTEEDIRANLKLSDKEKVEEGLLIMHATVTKKMHPQYQLHLSENNTKLRPGDKVYLEVGDKQREVRVIENCTDTLDVECHGGLDLDVTYKVTIREFVLLDPLIHLTESIEDGAPGSYWLELMAGLEEPDMEGFRPMDATSLSTIPATLNAMQRKAVDDILLCPTMYCLQGPPGTGKTDVLATLANTFSSADHEVLIISNTHQAVNNALNKIHKVNPDLTVVKVGEELKGLGLVEGVQNVPTFNSFLASRKKKKRSAVDSTNIVVGMTFQAAVINLGLRNTAFHPSVILVDEAGQMPLVQGALIGAFGSGTVVLIGDDLQMPPIFHEKLASDPLSVSVFTHVCNLFPQCRTALTTTYRMNEEITSFVSRCFYEPHGIKLISSDYSKKRHLSIENDSHIQEIHDILLDEQPVRMLNVSYDDQWEDSNCEEALFVAELVDEAIKHGLPAEDIAVITPYRRQVKTIREHVLSRLGRNVDLPLIDTVERLQGQDVEIIIISGSATNPDYLKGQMAFILEPHRLNVMISRAKTKVVMVMGQQLIDEFNSRYVAKQDDDPARFVGLLDHTDETETDFSDEDDNEGKVFVKHFVNYLFDNREYCHKPPRDYLGYIFGYPCSASFSRNACFLTNHSINDWAKTQGQDFIKDILARMNVYRPSEITFDLKLGTSQNAASMMIVPFVKKK